MRKQHALTTLCLLPALVLAAQADLTPTQLRCEYRVDPVGLDVTSPRLSWALQSDQQQQKQTAYRVLVASSPERLDQEVGANDDSPLLWDSGKVASDQTIHVVYEGRPLTSRMDIWWKVCVWDKDGQASV